MKEDQNDLENAFAWNNGITRRRFLKKTGGATAGVALLSLCDAQANPNCPSFHQSKPIQKTHEKTLLAGPFDNEPSEQDQATRKDNWEQNHPRSAAPPSGSSVIDTDYDCIHQNLIYPSSTYDNGDSIDNTFETFQWTEGEGADNKWYMKAVLTITETITYSATQ